jgi:hypothetical protein
VEAEAVELGLLLDGVLGGAQEQAVGGGDDLLFADPLGVEAEVAAGEGAGDLVVRGDA